MGIFDKIFGRTPAPPSTQGYYKLLNGYAPVFTSFGGDIYESELVRSSVDAIARNCSKLSINITGAAHPKLRDKLRKAPNKMQTWSQFLYRVSSILYVRNNAFIVPIFSDAGEIEGIYPIIPQEFELVQYANQPWIRFKFANGDSAAVELDRVGILTRFQLNSDYFGEGNKALMPTMELINIQKQGIKEGVKNGASFQFMATMSNFASDEDLVDERKKFTENNLKRGNGLLLWPNTYKDIKQLEHKTYVVDADQMAAIQTNVFNYFGVNEDVIQNKAIGDKWSAFYEGCIEPFAIQFTEVLNRMIYTERELTEGNQIMATANRLQYMSNSDKLNVSAQMADRGLMTRNEIREIWNLPPLPEGIGDKLPVRGEYYNLGDKE